MTLCIMCLDTSQIAAADVKSIMALLSQNSVAFSSGKRERAKRERVKISPTRKKRRGGREKNDHVSRLAWGDFHARSRFARSTIPEEKWGLLVVYGPTYT